MSTKPLRIFVSSTAADLEDYRDKAQEAILKLDNLPVAMEAFKAMPGTPVKECCRLAADADAVVVIVAYRYGFVPSKELDGDGDRSITWLEVEAARAARKPVFAFLIHPDHPWTRDREETRLTREPQQAGEISGTVQQLDAARNGASRSGNVEVQLPCYHLAAEIARVGSAFGLARSEAEAGIHLADTCGFGHHAIELRLALARVHLGAGDQKATLYRAREALERSIHPDCQYA